MKLKQDRGTLILALISTMENGKEKVQQYDADTLEKMGELRIAPDSKRIVMVFRYPDGSEKLVTHGPDWLRQTQRLIFSDAMLSSEQMTVFAAKANWEENPAMIRETIQVIKAFHGICLRAGHSGDDMTP